MSRTIPISCSAHTAVQGAAFGRQRVCFRDAERRPSRSLRGYIRCRSGVERLTYESVENGLTRGEKSRGGALFTRETGVIDLIMQQDAGGDLVVPAHTYADAIRRRRRTGCAAFEQCVAVASRIAVGGAVCVSDGSACGYVNYSGKTLKNTRIFYFFGSQLHCTCISYLYQRVSAFMPLINLIKKKPYGGQRGCAWVNFAPLERRFSLTTWRYVPRSVVGTGGVAILQRFALRSTL